MNCPHCQHFVPFDYQAASCPFCGHDFPTDFPAEQMSFRSLVSTSPKKWKYCLAFWLVFLGSPFLAYRFAIGGDGSDTRLFEMRFFGAIIILLVGAIVCGWTLQNIFRGRLVLQVILGMLVMLVYACIILTALLCLVFAI
jgi:hypothetical protein